MFDENVRARFEELFINLSNCLRRGVSKYQNNQNNKQTPRSQLPVMDIETRSYSELTNSYDENDPHLQNENSLDNELGDDVMAQELALEQEQSEALLEVDDDVTTLLQEIEEKDVGKQMASGLRSLMKKIMARYAAKIERKNRMLLAKTVSQHPTISLKSIVDHVAAVKKPGGKEDNLDENPDSADFMTVMLQKKMISMQKQIELAEQKSRSATLQW